MTALGRIGTVEDIATAAALLASPDSGWVTGQYFEASGGLGLVVPGFGTN
jgi:3-oxoacyl-[acyl-carrier protein] reductase